MKTPHFIIVLFLTSYLPTFGQINPQKRDSTRLDSLTTSTQLLNEITVIGTRYGVRSIDRVEALSVLNTSGEQHIPQMSMAHQLSKVSGVWMQKTNHGGGSPFVRGLTGYQVLMILDGIRFNNATFRSGPNQYANTIDPFSIERIELLRGAGAVHYGSDAIGGTIAMYSKSPYFSTEGTTINGSILGKLMSHGMEKSTRAELRIAGEKLSVLGGFTNQDLGDIHAGGQMGALEHTGYKSMGYDFKMKWKLSTKNTLTLAHQKMNQKEVPLFHKLVSGDYSTYHFDPQRHELTYLRLNNTNSNPLFSKIRYTLSYQKSLEIRKKQKSDHPIFTKETDKVKTFGATVEVISKITKDWMISSGLEYYGDKISSSSLEENSSNGNLSTSRGLYADNSNYLNMAAFTTHRFIKNRWNFNFGIRYNMFQLNIPDPYFGDSEISISKLVGNVGLNYKLNHSSRLVLGLSTAFRAPNINDVSSFGIADFRYEVPNDNLKPEESLILEAGWKMTTNKLSIGLFGYRNQLTDLITNTKSTFNGSETLEGYDVYRRENSNKAYLWGNELDLEYQFSSRFKSYFNLNYTFGKDASKDEPMRRIPPLFGRIGSEFSHGNITVGMEGVFAGKQSRLSSGDIADSRIQEGGTPAWNIINLHGGFKIKHLFLQLGLENLFDEAYRVHGSGVDGFGRSYWLSVHYKF